MAPSCTTSACHSQLAQHGSLELSNNIIAFEMLTGRACGNDSRAAGYVDVSDPRTSLLSIRLRQTGATAMPPNNRLTEDEIALIESWMSRGAPCD